MRFVPYSAGFLDSRFRGNDDSALLSVKNLPLKGAGVGDGGEPGGARVLGAWSNGKRVKTG